MREPTLRRADTDDVPGIQRVARAGWHAAYDDLLGSDTVDECVDDWYATESLTEPITDDDTVFLVATVDGRVVGYASTGPTGPNRPDDVAGLHSIYVHPDRWGDGVGSALLDACVARLRDRGFERLVLRVLDGNDVGIGFYRARGFECVDETTTELAGRSVDELVFARDL